MKNKFIFIIIFALQFLNFTNLNSGETIKLESTKIELLDKGNIILQVEEKIYEFDTQQSLYSRIMFKSLEYFNEVLDMVIADNPGKEQSNKGSFYKRGCPHNGELNIEWDIDKQKRFIKAMVNPPLDPAKLKGKDIFSFDDLENI